jgi:diaminopimelate decarboxylase
MAEEKELKFVRLKNTTEDLVGYVTYHEEHLTIETPLRIEIDTIFEEGRQILSMQEYLPQSVIEIKEVDIPLVDVLFATPVRKDFYEQYEYVSDFFYNNQSTIKSAKKKKKPDVKQLEENVVSIIEALAKKDKGPMH